MSKTKFQTLVEQYEQRLNESGFPQLSNIRPPSGGNTTQTTTASAIGDALSQDPDVMAAKEKVVNQINGGQGQVPRAQNGTIVPGVAPTQPPAEADPRIADAVENHPDVIAAKQRAAAAALQAQKRPNTITNP